MFETDEAVLARVDSGDRHVKSWSTDPMAGETTPHSIFFLYMRLNGNGTFEARQYYHKGNETDVIGPTAVYDAENKTLGYYIREMAINARKEKKGFPLYGNGATEIEFPSRYSYCVFFMDDLHWRFMTVAEPGGQIPVIVFNKSKNGETFKVHSHAFRTLPLVEMDMPNQWTTVGFDKRQAVVMVNRMRDENGRRLGNGQTEKFCFDFPMRVRYGSGSDGLTLIIDPTGTNLGPPVGPPDVP
jgi:hypothetical protein